MKKSFITISVVTLVLFSIAVSGATNVRPSFAVSGATNVRPSFQPESVDLWDLSHGSYYIWGIDWSIPEGEQIVGATLHFENIRNWREESNDLWVHLFDTSDEGAFCFRDTEAGATDAFRDQGILLNHWEDLSVDAQDILYYFTMEEIALLNDYAANGNFGLGFDPDCHFFNDGITLTTEMEMIPNPIPNSIPSPIPGAFWLLASGLAGFVWVSRRNRGK